VRLIAAFLAVVLSFPVFGKDVSLKDLPAEARETLALIKQNGPLPYPQDGKTFGNRERLLPLRAQGYYREYTVKTPGGSGRTRSTRDRGARRIISGNGGEFYYTEDHYRTFRRIRE
jgi:ribonuclease T1